MSRCRQRAADGSARLALAALALALAATAAPALPPASLYQLPVALQTASGARVALGSEADRVVVITMFYASCTSVCPLLTLSLQRLDRALTPAERARVRFVMVSLDSARDTPAALAAFAAEHGIEGPGWLLARAAPLDTRALAAALGIRYRQLPDGSFSHASLLTLLDKDGVPRARSSALGEQDAAFLAQLRAALR